LVVVPGIGGSVLETADGSPVWGQGRRQHLLPRYQAVRDEESGSEHYPHELGPGASEGGVRHAPGDRGGIGRARSCRAPGDAGALRPWPRHAEWAVLRGGRVRVTKTDAEWQPNVGWRGDGTVPALSAIPIELSDDARVRRAVADRHVPMATSAVAVETLKEYEAEPVRRVAGRHPGSSVAGAGRRRGHRRRGAVPVTAELLGTTDMEGAVAWLRVAPEVSPAAGGTPAVPPEPWETDGADGRWEVTLPGLAPGKYRLTVEAVNVPRVDRVPSGDVVGAIEP